jgi:hypothetical protein
VIENMNAPVLGFVMAAAAVSLNTGIAALTKSLSAAEHADAVLQVVRFEAPMPTPKATAKRRMIVGKVPSPIRTLMQSSTACNQGCFSPTKVTLGYFTGKPSPT